jgi:hypothetical protein
MHQNFVALVVHDPMLAVTWPVTKARVRASKPVVYQSFADPSFGFDRRAFRVTVISSERLYAPINVAIPATFETPAKSGHRSVETGIYFPFYQIDHFDRTRLSFSVPGYLLHSGTTR